ncbi:hypothetical protein XENOCAPTIV_025525 [Xenoophorus captivus]|uniref:Uncharacterized protein n=1 Tax=Xenoophorus captivus TaxID=1517983 RepID=A0ABV0QK14_9TELE
MRGDLVKTDGAAVAAEESEDQSLVNVTGLELSQASIFALKERTAGSLGSCLSADSVLVEMSFILHVENFSQVVLDDHLHGPVMFSTSASDNGEQNQV